jgi:hypothetical protein
MSTTAQLVMGDTAVCLEMCAILNPKILRNTVLVAHWVKIPLQKDMLD